MIGTDYHGIRPDGSVNGQSLHENGNGPFISIVRSDLCQAIICSCFEAVKKFKSAIAGFLTDVFARVPHKRLINRGPFEAHLELLTPHML
jgi:hypothetical protein